MNISITTLNVNVNKIIAIKKKGLFIWIKNKAQPMLSMRKSHKI